MISQELYREVRQEGFGKEFSRPDNQLDDSGESSASQQNSSLALVFEESLRDFRRRLDELEYANIGFQKMHPLAATASSKEIIDRLNYIVAILNKSLTEV